MFRRSKPKPSATLDSFRSPIHGVASTLTPPSANALLLWSTIAFVTLFGGAAVLELDEVVTAPARIEPSSLVRHVQHYEGGTIRDVLVREGAVVKAGDVLVRLVNSQGAQDLADRRARWVALEARTARLKADLSGARDIVWPSGVVIDAETKRRETAIHAERLGHRTQQMAVIQREEERRQKEITEIETRSTGLTRAQAKGGEEMKIKKKAYDAGVVGNQEIVRLEREQLMLDTEVSTSRDSISRIKAQLREAEAKLSEFEKGWRSGVLDDIGKAEAELTAVKATMAVADDRESRSEVRSPVNGVVKMAAITSVGQVARPGDTLMDILPGDDALVVDAKVAPQDIGQIREGLKVSVRLTAYDQFRYGHLDGRVTLVGADAIDEVRNNISAPYYHVLVRAERAVLTDSKGTDHAIRPGMVGSASIVIGRKSILRMV
ncbi:MAG: HlyD family type I secretion periplasmic adaptor subunit, partial [Magnetospirillum sp.]|nr:HlyD family type I secretion periplasmic adaptor subunit [Magnetospirillum sp.]